MGDDSSEVSGQISDLRFQRPEGMGRTDSQKGTKEIKGLGRGWRARREEDHFDAETQGPEF